MSVYTSTAIFWGSLRKLFSISQAAMQVSQSHCRQRAASAFASSSVVAVGAGGLHARHGNSVFVLEVAFAVALVVVAEP